MTEKVILTREQAKDVEEFKKAYSENEIWVPFNKFVDSLKYGYEVEPEFEVDQWVTVYSRVHKDVITRKIITVRNDNHITVDIDYFMFPIDRVRRATEQEIQQEKERRFWERNGRDVWELKPGDVLTINDELTVVEDVEYNIICLTNDRLTNGEFENIKHNIEVVCFAQNRLDVKAND